MLLLLLAATSAAHAQTGAWTPAGADLAYPRTLLKTQALPTVQASLAEPARLAIYATLWNDGQGSPTGDNTSASGRRARATWAKNAAFVVLVNRQGNGLAALTAPQRAALVASVRALLESINTNVEVFINPSGGPDYNEWQWRSKELIDYLVAYDLLRGAGETPASLAVGQTRLQEFAGNLYQQAMTPYSIYTYYGYIKNNHALMTSAALGMAAVVLNDATSADATRQPAKWVGAGLYQIDNILWRDAQRQSDSTQVAGYAEGPYYFKYGMLNCLPYFRAMGNFLPDGRLPYTFEGSTRSIRNPYYDPKYQLLYGWLTALLLPDGRMPALADSYVDMAMPELALTGNPQYTKTMAASRLTGTGMNSALAQLRDLTVDMRAAWLAAAVAPTAQSNPTLTALPGAGSLVFRSGNDSLATYLHVYGRGGIAQASSGGHSQGDAGSFVLEAQGQLLALDPGYLSYGRRAEVGQATNHNLVLVDGAGPAIGSPGTPSPAQAAIQNTFTTPQLTYGEATTAYRNASITRKTLFVRNSYFLVADALTAAAAHAYTWQLHGYGLDGGTATTGIFAGSLPAHEGTWVKNGVGLLAHVTATGGTATYSTATNPHETTYNTAENHTTLLVQSASTPQTQFLAALYPYTTQRPSVATTSQPTTAALAATNAGFVDIAFAQAESILTADASGLLPQPVSADGLLNFYSAQASGDFAQLFWQAGTVLKVGAAFVAQSSSRVDLSWQRTSAQRYEGYASRTTTLTLALPQAPASVSGPAVASYVYDAATQQLQVVLQAAGSFVVQTAPTSVAALNVAPLPVLLTSFTGQRTGPSVLLRWHTASEQQNQGFEVQRRADASPGFATIGFVAGQGTTLLPTDYTWRDTQPLAAISYYRLRQLDQDGKALYTPVAVVSSDAATATTLLPIAPQPAHDELRMQLTGPEQNVTLRLLDNLGRVVRQVTARQQAQVSLSGLVPGLYYLVGIGEDGKRLSGGQKVVVE
ncbi:MAG: heparinase II/III domain-containing protein [Janthinobacterium lividum]